MWIRVSVCVLLFAGVPTVWAAKDMTSVEGIQADAWMTRDGKRTPLKRGSVLKEKDEIETGPGARLMMRLPEGSTVKLGENAKLTIQSLQFDKTGKGLLGGALAVVQGAFRFTTDAARKYRGARDLKISLSTATAGIRGTDIWGKSFDDREVFMLIEGNVSITRANEPPVEMNEPLTVYSAPKDKPAAPLSPAEVDQITQWAAETEIGALPSGKKAKKTGGTETPDQVVGEPPAKPSKSKKAAVGRDDGKYFIAVAEFPSEEAALALYDRLRAAGMHAAIRPIPADAGTSYRVRVIGFESSSAAEAAVPQIKGLVPESQPRVSH
jgi:cell division septation protein DedD